MRSDISRMLIDNKNLSDVTVQDRRQPISWQMDGGIEDLKDEQCSISEMNNVQLAEESDSNDTAHFVL